MNVNSFVLNYDFLYLWIYQWDIKKERQKNNPWFGENSTPVKFCSALKNFSREVPGTIAPEFVTSFHEYVKNLRSTIARTHWNKISSSAYGEDSLNSRQQNEAATQHDVIAERSVFPFCVLGVTDLVMSEQSRAMQKAWPMIQLTQFITRLSWIQ